MTTFERVRKEAGRLIDESMKGSRGPHNVIVKVHGDTWLDIIMTAPITHPGVINRTRNTIEMNEFIKVQWDTDVEEGSIEYSIQGDK